MTCFGATDGSIDITVEGGCEPYSFAWSNGETTEDLNNIGAGIYTVTATDPNGLTISLEIEITEPAELTATETISSYECGYGVTCFGATDGSIDITVEGGCEPYTFAWSNGETTEDISNLGVGTYSVDITDANGCTFNIPSIEITEPDELTITETHSSYECEYGVSELGATDGSIDITVEGGL